MPKKKAPAPSSANLALLKQYTPLVLRIVGAFQRNLPRSILREDLIAAGTGGLWDAISRNTGTGSDARQLERYLQIRIRGAIVDELRRSDWLPRRARKNAEEAIAAGNDAFLPPPAIVRFEDLAEWDQESALQEASTTERELARKEVLEGLRKLVVRLPKRDRYLVTQYYLRGVKFSDLARKLGVSAPRVSQIHTRALARLRELVAQAGKPPKRKRKPAVRRKRRRKVKSRSARSKPCPALSLPPDILCQ